MFKPRHVARRATAHPRRSAQARKVSTNQRGLQPRHVVVVAAPRDISSSVFLKRAALPGAFSHSTLGAVGPRLPTHHTPRRNVQKCLQWGEFARKMFDGKLPNGRTKALGERPSSHAITYTLGVFSHHTPTQTPTEAYKRGSFLGEPVNT